VRDTARDAAQDARDALDGRGTVRGNRARQNFRAADLGIWFDRSARNGLVIADVAADAALGRIGFREGDRIVSVGGQTITTEADFVRYLRSNNNRGRIDVIVLRDGQRQTLYVEPTVFTQTMTVEMDPLEQFGIILDDRYDDRLVVWRVVPRSAAFYAGIRAGDVITTFANERLGDPRAFVQVLQQTKPGLIPIQVSRNGAVRVIHADFEGFPALDRHTTFRQDLDADVNVQGRASTPAGRISADANAEINPAPMPVNPDAANAVPLPDRRPTYSNSGSSNSSPRGLFRRRR
jgi:S1-C subfamily serine protease